MGFDILEEKNNEVNDLMRTMIELGREEKDLEALRGAANGIIEP